MALSAREKYRLSSPYHYSKEDLFASMERVMDDDVRQELGSDWLGIVLGLHQASLNKRVNPPVKFAQYMQRLAVSASLHQFNSQ